MPEDRSQFDHPAAPAPAAGKEKSLQVRMPSALHERLHKTAESRMVGANLIVNKALERFLEELDSKPAL